VGKKYGYSKGYPQRNAARMGIIFGQNFFLDILCFHIFCPQITQNATLFYRAPRIPGRHHLVTAATLYSHTHTDRCASQ
jgi:hypothetical protein